LILADIRMLIFNMIFPVYLYALLLLIPASNGHFVLNVPTSLGFEDIKEGQGPCGGFDIKGREAVTEFPLGGQPFAMLSTHNTALWRFRAALLNDTETWVDLLPPVAQEGLGNFCLPTVPGVQRWVGMDAVVQVTQDAVDGTLFQVC
jgi:hypothetical protein